MPQMAPINWLSLLFMFCLTFLTFNILNYFLFNINMIYKKKNNMNNQNIILNKYLNWKW